MATKKLTTIAQELDFSSTVEVMEYIIESFITGQKKQCRNLYNRIKADEKQMVTAFIQANNEEVFNFLTK